jgi:hypothetical protein
MKPTDGSRLPFELQVLILQHLHSGSSTDDDQPFVCLASCALVCASWLAIVQPRIFSTIVITPKGDPYLYDQIVQMRDLLSVSPHLASYIRRLIIGTSASRTPSADFVTAMAQGEMFAFFGNVLALEVHADSLSGLQLLYLAIPAKITELRFYGTTLPSFKHIIQAFPFLTSLYLSSVSFKKKLPVYYGELQQLFLRQPGKDFKFPDEWYMPQLEHFALEWMKVPGEGTPKSVMRGIPQSTRNLYMKVEAYKANREMGTYLSITPSSLSLPVGY